MKHHNSSGGFTLIEVLVTVVVLSIGAVGLFRSFLASLDYQRYLASRLYVLNLINDHFSIAENKLLTRQALPARSDLFLGSSVIGQSNLSLKPLNADELTKGLNYLTIEHQVRLDQRNLTFTRSSFIYVDKDN